MARSYESLRSFGLLVALLIALVPAHAGTLPNTGLMGTVKSADGKPMEGVAVSARSQDRTFTTSVYTNGEGEYYFPSLADGGYRIWAQAIGFETARSEPMTLASDKKIQKDFVLKSMQNFSKQLSGTEWLESLPNATPEDRRMKRVISYNCATCHTPAFPLNKRFDAAGWNIILSTMIHEAGGPNSPNGKYIQSYKEDLVAYLSRVRGPEPFPGTFKSLPRASGEATEIVVTEYDIPFATRPDHVVEHNGTDWSEGMPSRYELWSGVGMHDSVVGKDGNIYFSDPSSPERTAGRLDPRTGRVTNFKLDDKNGLAVGTHGAVADQKGNIWFTNETEGTILKFDPKTESFQRFPKPGLAADIKFDPGTESFQGSAGPGASAKGKPENTGAARVSGAIVVDSKGNVWAVASTGAVRLNPATGVYTDFKSVTPKGSPYGIAVDSADNAWITQLGSDRFMVVDGHTDEVSEVVLPPLEDWKMDQKDIEIGQRDGSSSNSAPINHIGPRRIGADPVNGTVWSAEYWAGRLAKIDIKTNKVTEYPMLSSRFHHPYAVVVDKNHMVWITLLSSDRVAKFNPYTEQFTEYRLPSLGTQARFITVDNTTGLPTIWIPEDGIDKIARVQFRASTADPLSGQKN